MASMYSKTFTNLTRVRFKVFSERVRLYSTKHGFYLYTTILLGECAYNRTELLALRRAYRANL